MYMYIPIIWHTLYIVKYIIVVTCIRGSYTTYDYISECTIPMVMNRLLHLK